RSAYWGWWSVLPTACSSSPFTRVFFFFCLRRPQQRNNNNTDGTTYYGLAVSCTSSSSRCSCCSCCEQQHDPTASKDWAAVSAAADNSATGHCDCFPCPGSASSD